MGAFIICTSQRTGGTLLCSMLSDTNLVGKPAAYLRVYRLSRFLNTLTKEDFLIFLKNVSSRFHKQKEKLCPLTFDISWLFQENILDNIENIEKRYEFFYHQLRSENLMTYFKKIRNSELGGENWGLKVVMHNKSRKGDFASLLKQLKKESGNVSSSEIELLKLICPNVKFIWLTRRNKIKQAISLLKARKTSQWHIYNEQGSLELKKLKTIPSHKDLSESLIEVAANDSIWDDFFSKNNIIPLSLIYEDLIEKPEKSIKEIIGFLGIKEPNKKIFNGFKEQKMANQESEYIFKNFLKLINMGLDVSKSEI